jgi:DNA-binding response OmpR family regulator
VDRTILLIDTDLGFLFWLGTTLDQAGFDAFPARTVPDAITLLVQLHLGVGMLILNFGLPGADEFVANMRQWNNRLKVISLVSQGEWRDAPGADAVCYKPVRITDQARAELLHIIQKTFLSNVVIS